MKSSLKIAAFALLITLTSCNGNIQTASAASSLPTNNYQSFFANKEMFLARLLDKVDFSQVNLTHDYTILNPSSYLVSAVNNANVELIDCTAEFKNETHIVFSKEFVYEIQTNYKGKFIDQAAKANCSEINIEGSAVITRFYKPTYNKLKFAILENSISLKLIAADYPNEYFNKNANFEYVEGESLNIKAEDYEEYFEYNRKPENLHFLRIDKDKKESSGTLVNELVLSEDQMELKIKGSSIQALNKYFIGWNSASTHNAVVSEVNLSSEIVTVRDFMADISK